MCHTLVNKSIGFSDDLAYKTLNPELIFTFPTLQPLFFGGISSPAPTLPPALLVPADWSLLGSGLL